MSGSIKMKCSCKHEFQDKLYGAFMRVWTLCKGGASARCTVCRAQKVLREGK